MIDEKDLNLKAQMLVSIISMEEYLGWIKESIPRMVVIDREREIGLNKLFKINKDKGIDITVDYPRSFMISYVPKLLYNSYILILWSLFEEKINTLTNDWKLADYWASYELTIDDIKHPWLERVEMFWLHHFYEGEEHQSLRALRYIRNVIAHDDSKTNDKETAKWIKYLSTKGFDIFDEGEVRSNEEFCLWAYKVIKDLLQSIIVFTMVEK